MELVLSSEYQDTPDKDTFQSEIHDLFYDDHFNEILKQTCLESEVNEEDEAYLHDFKDFSDDLDWYTATENLMLDELSNLCLNLHSKLNRFSGFENCENICDEIAENLDSLNTNKRSSSSENISNFLENKEYNEDKSFIPSNFERDHRIRRSLPATNTFDRSHFESFGYNKTSNNLSEEKPNLLTKENESCNKQLLKLPEEVSDSQQSKKSIVKLNTNLSNEVDNKADKDDSRSVKKVGFSKTEIHFAPDSGKINIVETDRKPPPTNRFRRRRRDHIKNSANFPVKCLPVTHFGDTSYEKYIFGGRKRYDRINSTHEEIVGKGISDVDKSAVEDDNYKSVNENDINKSKKEDLKHRGHISTINFITDDMRDSLKLPQDVNDSSNVNVHLHIDKEMNRKSPTPLNTKQNESLVTRTTKMTVHIPLTVPEIPHLKSLSSLKSVRLILNLKPIINNKKVQELFTSFYDPTKLTSNLKHYDYEEEDMKKEYDKDDEGRSDTTLNINKKDQELNDPSDNLSLRTIHHNQNINDNISSIDSKNNLISLKTTESYKPVVSQVEKDYILNTLGKASKTERSTDSTQRTQKRIKDKESYKENKELVYVNIFNHNDEADEQLYENVFTAKLPQSKKKEVKELSQNKIINQIKIHQNKGQLHTSTVKSIKKDSKPSDKKLTNTNNNSKVTSSLQDGKTISSTNRSKKPIEIVYKTAVFNMPNETLSKPPKLKETKPSLSINNLIFNKKSKNSSEKKNFRNSLLKQNRK